MSGEMAVLRKVLGELGVWLSNSAIALGISLALLEEAVTLFYSGSWMTGIAVGLFSSIWLAASLILLYGVLRVCRRNDWLPIIGIVLPRRVRNRVITADDAVAIIKDTISLYRGHRHYVVLVGILGLAAGLGILILSLHGYLLEVFGLGEFLYRFLVGLIIFFYAALILYLERRLMARKLARVSSFERDLMRFLE